MRGGGFLTGVGGMGMLLAGAAVVLSYVIPLVSHVSWEEAAIGIVPGVFMAAFYFLLLLGGMFATMSARERKQSQPASSWYLWAGIGAGGSVLLTGVLSIIIVIGTFVVNEVAARSRQTRDANQQSPGANHAGASQSQVRPTRSDEELYPKIEQSNIEIPDQDSPGFEDPFDPSLPAARNRSRSAFSPPTGYPLPNRSLPNRVRHRGRSPFPTESSFPSGAYPSGGSRHAQQMMEDARRRSEEMMERSRQRMNNRINESRQRMNQLRNRSGPRIGFGR